jgi:hypothetical protein
MHPQLRAKSEMTQKTTSVYKEVEMGSKAANERAS